ncbi:hypothetical protein PPYR_05799 [Photinus pyralis]|uniref:MARVEL domain-containing protein n=1 Tax=Photinus pyralis TaxID=7054 RepID=A0A1Y1KR83_PHOPY|nr:synaptophysin-like protein 2 [Photinus pyralis]KAB0801445.1 hypothetical protein PPYR_05799 [Photinus pyralis]
MDLNLSVFQEPRGVMRLLQFIFTISAFAAISGYSGSVNFNCESQALNASFTFNFDYPFKLFLNEHPLNSNSSSPCKPIVTINGDFSSDAQFFVTTGVLAMLYTIAIIIVYIKLDNLYKTNSQVPLMDFVLTVVFAVLWLSSSAAWANGLSGLKHVTSDEAIEWKGDGPNCPKCPTYTTSFSTLNISVVLGFLNFFLWGSDLWFVYKETAWFQGNQGLSTSGV